MGLADFVLARARPAGYVEPRFQSFELTKRWWVNDANACHAPTRDRVPDHSGRYAMGWHCRTRFRGIQRWRPWHSYGADAADARRSEPRDRAHARDDRPAIWR